ncbi:alanine racemase [Halocynthiibacter styelae]|uniref:alanine racemase n=1 Tax=Halocynthiibacter styelae TaxID=2761955 RepID=A0A8J7IJG7_9RHOB|nr:alanine racemase [Paenihalocynthiibacter styelae]MBI1494213.1 alanine racemase [Paenihalocynthiibacter styelae]
MTEPVKASWCEIYPDRIANNLKIGLDLIPPETGFCAVLKADAYGHGINAVVPVVMAAGVNHIGITSNAEARAVRDAGFAGNLLRLRSATPVEIRDALQDRVQEQVSSPEAAQIFAKLAQEGHPNPGLHLALNADGMSRDGLELSTAEGQQACLRILDLVGGHIAGICTHFPSNTPEDLRHSDQRFQADVSWVIEHSRLKRTDVLVHAGSSLTLGSRQPVTTDMYRCGALLYGIINRELGFRPTIELKAHITNVGSYPKGSTIGYDRAVTLDQPRRLANVSLGYANGFGRDSFGRGEILIRGQKVPILGKISMNTIIADVTGLTEVQSGDEAVVFGQQGQECIDIVRSEHQFRTIMADLFVDWGGRSPRVYLPGTASC